MGYDSCVKGAVCLSGECKQICDNAGGAPCNGYINNALVFDPNPYPYAAPHAMA